MYHIYEPRDDQEAREMDESNRVHNHFQQVQDERERQLRLLRAELARAQASAKGDASGYYKARIVKIQRQIADLERLGTR